MLKFAFVQCPGSTLIVPFLICKCVRVEAECILCGVVQVCLSGNRVFPVWWSEKSQTLKGSEGENVPWCLLVRPCVIFRVVQWCTVAMVAMQCNRHEPRCLYYTYIALQSTENSFCLTEFLWSTLQPSIRITHCKWFMLLPRYGEADHIMPYMTKDVKLDGAQCTFV